MRNGKRLDGRPNGFGKLDGARQILMEKFAEDADLLAEEQARGRRRTSLLALTAMTQELDRARCEAAGFDAYLAKPVRGAELLEKLGLLAASQEAALGRVRDDEFAANLEAAETEDAEDLKLILGEEGLYG